MSPRKKKNIYSIILASLPWFMILLMYFWTWLTSILLRLLEFIFIKDIGQEFAILVLLLSDLRIMAKLALLMSLEVSPLLQDEEGAKKEFLEAFENDWHWSFGNIYLWNHLVLGFSLLQNFWLFVQFLYLLLICSHILILMSQSC